MDYIRITNLINKYPTVENYQLQPNNKTILFGVYPDYNSVEFDLFNYTRVIPTSDISSRSIFVLKYNPNFVQLIGKEPEMVENFGNPSRTQTNRSTLRTSSVDKFIEQAKTNLIGTSIDDSSDDTTTIENQNLKNSLEKTTQTQIAESDSVISDESKTTLRIFANSSIFDNEDGNDIKVFCSQQYFSDLELSRIEGNPYFINLSFEPQLIVEVNLNTLITLKNSQTQSELDSGVLMSRNNFIKGNNVYSQYLLSYLDWVVSLPTLDEIDTKGVIPANLLCEYQSGTFDKKTGAWNTSVNQNGNTTTNENTSGGRSGGGRSTGGGTTNGGNTSTGNNSNRSSEGGRSSTGRGIIYNR